MLITQLIVCSCQRRIQTQHRLEYIVETGKINEARQRKFWAARLHGMEHTNC
uniref:Uncharacterized protein n=1 Tax=Arion vulgaris TaxID=1028688 RepID=A0A0B7AWD4_9EUPU